MLVKNLLHQPGNCFTLLHKINAIKREAKSPSFEKIKKIIQMTVTSSRFVYILLKPRT
jgi:hypothetical protein